MENNHIFILCSHIDYKAFVKPDNKYTIRKLDRNELDIWKTIHFDTKAHKKE